MDIHKPKPWHGLREFLKEYLIIVVGVLTALGGEQLVEWLHWRHQTYLAREALAADFQRVLGDAAERTAVTPCIAARIEEVTRIVDHASVEGRLPPLGFLGTIPIRPWNLRSWDTLEQSQTLAHMSHEEMRAFSGIQLYLINRQAIVAQERHSWALLNSLAGPGRKFGEAEEAQVRGLLSLSASDASNMAKGAQLLPGMIRETHLLSEAQVAAAEEAGRALAPQSFMCRPIGPAPAVSGGMLQGFKDLTP
jgi:hypothetical protein